MLWPRTSRPTRLGVPQRRLLQGKRDLSARELAARGYAHARAAVSSLHPSLIEGIGDFLPISTYTRDQIRARRAELRQALTELDQVSALLAGTDTGRTAAAVARHLVVLDDAWRTAPQSLQGLPPVELERAEEAYVLAGREIRASRQTLLGYAEETYQQEAGRRLTGLLGALAEAIGSAAAPVESRRNSVAGPCLSRDSMMG